MTAPDTTAPDLAGSTAYTAPGRGGTGTWYVTTDRTVLYQRPDGAWTPPPIISADDLENSPTWQRVDA